MKSKLKECDGCQKMTVIWKNHEGLRLCKYCWSCQNPKNRDSSQKPNDYKVPQVSSKKKKKDVEYLKLRERFLTENPICQVSVAGCMIHSTDVHHKFSGSDRNTYYLIQSTWMACCRSCHQWIHLNSKEARILGYLK
jgi:hypothetical protein